jgi:TusA-related sulfurtransferase
MKQEVQVTLTVWIDAEKSKEDIEKFFRELNYFEVAKIDIKEEMEIYGNF